MSIVSVKNLKYRYPSETVLALDDISFEVKKGECIGVIGQNGSGKSTLCQAVVGLVPHFYKGAYGGRVIVDGISAGDNDVGEMLMKAGIVFQNPFTQVTGAKRTVYEETAFGLENLGLPRDEIRRRTDEALKLLNIYEYRERHPLALSGGQMQRMAIAGIIAMKPAVIVLDEPTSQLDPGGVAEVFAAIAKLKSDGATIIFAEHKMEPLAEYCDKLLLLCKGKLIDFAPPKDVFARCDLEDFGIRPPVYTRLCKRLDRFDGHGRPATLDEAASALEAK